MTIAYLVALWAVLAAPAAARTDPPASGDDPSEAALELAAPPAQRDTEDEELDLVPRSQAVGPIDLGGKIQMRWNLNQRDVDDGEDGFDTGFQLRRVTLALSADITDRISVYGEANSNRSDGTFENSTLHATISLNDEWSLRIGRFRPPFHREQFLSSSRQTAVERSLVSVALGQGIGGGVRLRYSEGSNRLYASLVDLEQELAGDDRWAAAVRLEHRFLGSWGMQRDYSPDERGRTALMGGLAAAYQWEDRFDRVERTRTRATGDLTFKYEQISLFAAGTYVHVQRNDGRRSLDEFGAVVQGVWAANETWEFFARYEWGSQDEAGPELSVVTLGTTARIVGDAVKFTADVGFALDEVDGFWATTGAGWLEDDPGQNGQIVVRAQLQIRF